MTGTRGDNGAKWLSPGNHALILLWSVLALLVLAADFVSGPYVQFPILYFVPIALAAWYNGRWAALAFIVATVLPRYGFELFWQMHNRTEAVLDLVTNLIAFGIFAVLIDQIAIKNRALSQEIKTLRGILPICSMCKKIRTEDQHWEQLEQYISEHSEAQFTHSLCPDCVAKQLEALDKAGHFGRRKDDML